MGLLGYAGLAGLAIVVIVALTISESEVKKENVIKFQKKQAQKHIVRLDMKISGFVEGDALINLIENDKLYMSEKVHGKFSFKWGCDWYSDTAEIRYKPTDVKSGEILIQYNFIE